MRWRTAAKRAALTGALALGLGLGLAGPGLVANAQTTPQTETAAGTSALAGRFLDQLASALGIQRSALDSALSSAAGSTAAAAVADGTITQEQADALVARAQAGDYGALFGGRGGRGGHAGARVEGLRTAMIDAAARTLGITADELHTALRGGQTLAELAAANGTTEQAVTDAALAAAKATLDAAVADGSITQAQADAIYAQLEERGLMLGGRGGPRGGRLPPAETVTPEQPAETSDA